jgi:hypothetical protein
MHVIMGLGPLLESQQGLEKEEEVSRLQAQRPDSQVVAASSVGSPDSCMSSAAACRTSRCGLGATELAAT